MFGATTNYPFNFANRNGIPMIESNSNSKEGLFALNKGIKFSKFIFSWKLISLILSNIFFIEFNRFLNN